MTTDQVIDIIRHLLREALLVSAPVLLAASGVSLTLSLVQTLTSIQDQTLSTVPRIVSAVLLLLIGLPWFLHRLVSFTVGLLSDFHRYL